MKIIIITIFFLFSIVTVHAQDDRINIIEQGEEINSFVSYEQKDSIPHLNLIRDFYSKQNSLTRTYDYELLNLKKKYEKWSKDITIFGYGLALGIDFVGGFFANKHHWSLGWYVPAATIIMCGGFYGIAKWSEHYSQKANAIHLSPLYSLNLNDTFSIQALCISNTSVISGYGVGLGFTSTF